MFVVASEDMDNTIRLHGPFATVEKANAHLSVMVANVMREHPLWRPTDSNIDPESTFNISEMTGYAEIDFLNSADENVHRVAVLAVQAPTESDE